MSTTYYNVGIPDEKVQQALNAVSGLLIPANSGKVLAISGGKLEARSVTWGGGSLQSKTATPSASQQVITPDSDYEGLSSVTVEGDADLVAGNIKKDVEIFGVTGSYEGSGGATLIPKSFTQNGTYNASSDNADGYSQVTVNVSGGATTPSLPNSVQDNILASAHAGNFVDSSSPWGGFELGNTTYIGADKDSVGFTYGGYARYDLGEINRSCVCYIVASSYDHSSGVYPRVISFWNANSTNKEVTIDTNLNIINYAHYGIAIATYPTKAIHLFAAALRIDGSNKVSSCFINGAQLGATTAFTAAGRYCTIASAYPNTAYAALSVKYAGIVDGVESDATIIANLQYLMGIFGISA